MKRKKQEQNIITDILYNIRALISFSTATCITLKAFQLILSLM